MDKVIDKVFDSENETCRLRILICDSFLGLQQVMQSRHQHQHMGVSIPLDLRAASIHSKHDNTGPEVSKMSYA